VVSEGDLRGADVPANGALQAVTDCDSMRWTTAPKARWQTLLDRVGSVRPLMDFRLPRPLVRRDCPVEALA